MRQAKIIGFVFLIIFCFFSSSPALKSAADTVDSSVDISHSIPISDLTADVIITNSATVTFNLPVPAAVSEKPRFATETVEEIKKGVEKLNGVTEAINLSNLLVIIDPGHGGSDEGAHIEYLGHRITEDEYAYDIALRLERLLLAASGNTYFTVVDPNQAISEATFLEEWDRDEFFNGEKRRLAQAGAQGLLLRVASANQALADFIKNDKKRCCVVFVSIHIDSQKESIKGVMIIKPQGQEVTPLILGLKESFSGPPNLLRTKNGIPFQQILEPTKNYVVVRGQNNASPKWGGKDINRIQNRTLVELGNINNPEDLQHLLDPNFREEYAKRIFDGIVRMMEIRGKLQFVIAEK